MAIEKDEKQTFDTEARERAINVLHTLSRPEALRYWEFLYVRYDGALPWQCPTVDGTKIKWTANVEGFQIYFRLFREDRPNGWIYPHGNCRHLLPVDWCAVCGKSTIGLHHQRKKGLGLVRPPDRVEEMTLGYICRKALSLVILPCQAEEIKNPEPTGPTTESDWNGWLDALTKLKSPKKSVGKDLNGWCYRFGLAIKARMGTAWTNEFESALRWVFEQAVGRIGINSTLGALEEEIYRGHFAPHEDSFQEALRSGEARAKEWLSKGAPEGTLFLLAQTYGRFGEICVRLIADHVKEFKGDPIGLFIEKSKVGVKMHPRTVCTLAFFLVHNHGLRGEDAIQKALSIGLEFTLLKGELSYVSDTLKALVPKDYKSPGRFFDLLNNDCDECTVVKYLWGASDAVTRWATKPGGGGRAKETNFSGGWKLPFRDNFKRLGKGYEYIKKIKTFKDQNREEYDQEFLAKSFEYYEEHRKEIEPAPSHYPSPVSFPPHPLWDKLAPTAIRRTYVALKYWMDPFVNRAMNAIALEIRDESRAHRDDAYDKCEWNKRDEDASPDNPIMIHDPGRAEDDENPFWEEEGGGTDWFTNLMVSTMAAYRPPEGNFDGGYSEDRERLHDLSPSAIAENHALIKQGNIILRDALRSVLPANRERRERIVNALRLMQKMSCDTLEEVIEKSGVPERSLRRFLDNLRNAARPGLKRIQYLRTQVVDGKEEVQYILPDYGPQIYHKPTLWLGSRDHDEYTDNGQDDPGETQGSAWFPPGRINPNKPGLRESPCPMVDSWLEKFGLISRWILGRETVGEYLSRGGKITYLFSEVPYVDIF